MKEKKCVFCGGIFFSNQGRAKYCSRNCREKYLWQNYFKKHDAERRNDPDRRKMLRLSGLKHNQKISRKLSQQRRDLNNSLQKPVGKCEAIAYDILKKIFKDEEILLHRRRYYDANGKLLLDLDTGGLRKNLELDFFIPDLLLGIEIDESYHHYNLKNKQFKIRDALKTELCGINGIKLIRFNEEELDYDIFCKRLSDYLGDYLEK